jgi:hypothetical protein
MRRIRSAAACLIVLVALSAPNGSLAQLRQSTVTADVGCEWRGYVSWGYTGVKLWIVNTRPHPLPAGTRVNWFYTLTPHTQQGRVARRTGGAVLPAPLAMGASVNPYEAPTHTPPVSNLPGGYELPTSCTAQATYNPALLPPQISPNQPH